jgi:hypothetical protein
MADLILRLGRLQFNALDRLRANWFDAMIVLLLAVLLPGLTSYWLVVNPFGSLVVFRYVLLAALLLFAFQFVLTKSPWYTRLITSMVIGQIILSYGFSNIVIGGGSAKFTLAESGVLLGLLFLLPKAMPVLRQIPIFWIAVLAMLMPAAMHLVPDVKKYGLAALRDFLSVADLMYFIAGLAVTAYGVMLGRWLVWRQQYLKMWLLGGAIYGMMSPLAPYMLIVSPVFQSYQQSVAVLGSMLTAPFNTMAALAAWYAIPFTFPANRLAKYFFFAAAFLGTIFTVALAQSRNYYGIFLMLPVVLGYFGYRKAFASTVASVLVVLSMLLLFEVFGVRIQGRISDLTLSAVVDRAMTLSGKGGDKVGAHGVNQRMDWWTSSIDKWRATPLTMAFGVGYGQALTNFEAPGTVPGSGVMVREPHNSYVSSLSRGGLAYFGLWLYILFAPMHMAFKGARLKGLTAEEGGGYRGMAAWSFLVMTMMVMTAMSEPIFETPSIAALFYFLAGITVVEYSVMTRNLRLPSGAAP